MRKVRSGEPAKAEHLNSAIDEIVKLQATVKAILPSDAVFLRNDSGAEVTTGQILGIAGFSFAPSDGEGVFLDYLSLRGVTPDLSDHEFKYAVALEPIADGSIGRCAVDGLVRVRLNVIDENDDYAIVDDGEVVLASHWYGNARILAKETEAGSGTGSVLSTGEMWAVVRLNDPSEMKFVGKTSGSGIAAGSSGAVTVYALNDDGDEWEPLQREEGDVVMSEVWHPPVTGDVDDVAGDAWVQIERDTPSNRWIVDVEYCPPQGS